MNNLFSGSFSRPDGDDDSGNNHSHVIEMTSDSGENLDAFFKDVDAVKLELQNLETHYSDLQSCHEESKTLHNAQSVKNLRYKMDSHVSNSLKIAKTIKSKLEYLDKSNAASRSIAGCGPGSSSDRTRVSVVNGLRKKLQITMTSFNSLRETIAVEYRDTVKRRYYTVTGENADESTVENLISTGESESFLQKAIQQQGRGQVMDTISEIQERHDAVKTIEKNLIELNQVFLDMAVLVESQGEQLDDIESNVGRANSYVRGATRQLEVAKKTQRNTRKWKMEGVRSAEWVVCTLWEALAVGMALYAEKCLLLFLLEKTGVLPVDGFQDCQMDKRVPLVLLCRKEDSNDEDHDHGKPMDDNGKPLDDHGKPMDDNGIEDHIPGGDGSSDDDQEPEDYSGSHNDRRSDDNEENEDDDDGDDDDTDMEDYYDEDEEETDEEDQDESEDDISTSGDGTDDNNQYPLLKHAKDVYTSDDFRLFEDECKKMKTLDIDVKDDTGLTARGVEITYEVGKQWQYHRGYTVAVLPFDGIVECTCKYFEFSGILCCHAQAALSCLRIDKIPDRCIVQKDKNPLSAPTEEVDTSKKNQEECYQSTDVEKRINCPDPPLLRHARDVFNSKIFDMFKEEYKKSEYYFAREVGVSDAGELKVKHKVEKPGSYRCHMVLAAADTGRAICNCKKFKKTQLLCRHVIVVLDYLCIVKIPGHYILDKYKKDECVSIVQEIHGPEYAGLRSFLLSRAMNSTFNESLDEGCVSEECARLWELFTCYIMHKMNNPDGKVVVKNPRVASGSSKRDTSPDGQDGAADN